MLFFNPFQLGVVACPGGEAFASEILFHLKMITLKKYRNGIESLAKSFEKSEEEVREQVRFLQNIVMPGSHMNQLQTPNYKIEANFCRFANGEFKTELLSSIRGMDVYVVQDVENHTPLTFNNSKEPALLSVNDHIFSMLVTVDAVLQAGASRVTIVLPTYPYSRQHKKNKREGLTASRFGQLMESLGVARIITLDIHSKEIENCFNRLRLENLHASYQILRSLNDLIDLHDPELVIVSPDTGAVERNKFYAESLNVPLAMLYKERDYSKISQNAIETNISNMRLLGDVAGKTVFMCDDMLGTGGTLIKAMKYLKQMGAKKVIAAISLPLFNGNAVEYFDEAYKDGIFDRIIGTNAVYHSRELCEREWYISANVSKLFALSIYRLHTNKNLSKILDNSNLINKLLGK